ncbi:iron chaperone [Spirilliplanes yamanashiensis]|uniref:YdhG-like domain-containing protein n=1 Tax=Spirilliplanes yamanashiensis TaxID=42233 RepID=A0A8J3Y7W9_9ACTN|nr:DUF1801 domain-containing protein [Spirilliplanes yamanashiensis]MDP9817407.1 uncharacterized protein YdhG (YjbR/CyaY superfamily) [Spirilliplanes yamanashiensis]GIJ02942.1 hypothetical protein Sya03_22940 [Spirilliplanes yamanashiensis]
MNSVDDYLAAQPADVRERLAELRRRIHAAVPGAGEAIRYGMPTVTLGGSSLVHLAAWKKHIALYPVPGGDDAYERAVAPYRGAKDAAHFPHRDPLPYDVAVLIVERLAALHRQD